jgi:hypothetical protein
VPRNQRYFGIIVRTNWDYNSKEATGSTRPITVGKVSDGLSKTLIVAEKRLRPKNYALGDWHDDRGWTDGWDPDTVRSTNFPIGRDTDSSQGLHMGDGPLGYHFGSAHRSGMNAAHGDGSGHHISYDIDPAVLETLADRRDGRVVPSTP